MKILIVDDEPDIRSVAALSLREIGGMEVVEACDGASGIEAARQEKPDAILMDYFMPDMDGPEALAALSKDNATAMIPVIILTARRLDSRQCSEVWHGAAGFISKPFSPKELPRRIITILRKRESERL